YLVLPLMEPMTIRDGIGRGVDAAMNPLTWVGPTWWMSLTMRAVEMVNDRALNIELFQGLEESVVDLYSAVRNGYLRRREQMIKEEGPAPLSRNVEGARGASSSPAGRGLASFAPLRAGASPVVRNWAPRPEIP